MPASLIVVVALLFIFVVIIAWLVPFEISWKCFFGIPVTLMWLSFIGWGVYSCCLPLEIESEGCYEVMDVVYPNGTQAQYIYDENAGRNVNISHIVSGYVTKGYMVKVTHMKRMYAGLLWETPSVNDRYEVVPKK